jgi:hypothetical protein
MLIALGGLAVTLLILLMIPYSACVEHKAGATTVALSIAGLRLPKSRISPGATGGRSPKPGPNLRPSPREVRRGPPMRKVQALLFSKGFLPSIARLARRLARVLAPRHLRVYLRFGLDDPFDTGRLWGALAPLFLSLSTIGADELRFEPDFLERSFRLDLSAEVRVVPGVLILLVLGYFLTRAPWRAMRRFAQA